MPLRNDDDVQCGVLAMNFNFYEILKGFEALIVLKDFMEGEQSGINRIRFTFLHHLNVFFLSCQEV